jgi:hypothetical protein
MDCICTLNTGIGVSFDGVEVNWDGIEVNWDGIEVNWDGTGAGWDDIEVAAEHTLVSVLVGAHIPV